MKVKGGPPGKWEGQGKWEREKEGEERVIEGMNMISVHCTHIWKCDNESS
jgi:hypothetical protein